MWQWLRSRQPSASPVPLAEWQAALTHLPLLSGVPADSLEKLRYLSGGFVASRHFEPVQGLELSPLMQTIIAAQACLPILQLGLEWYDDWRTLVVYPGEFIRPREEFDDDGIVHQWEEILGGEAWERGPLVLSWTDVEASGQQDGYNVVIHEMAHKLDMHHDGAADGFPRLHRNMRRQDWTAAFSRAFHHLNARLDKGEETTIDPYAAESPGEFFAVLSEYFFEQPALLISEYPDVYRQLAAFYRLDPARWPVT